MKKRDLAIIFNAIIIVFELIGFICSFIYNNKIFLEFYTEDSNILALICSTIFLFYLIINKKIPNWLRLFKYIATVSLTITLLVVILILVPMGNFDFKAFMFDGTMLYHHTICPILSIITFLFFDNLKAYNQKETLIALSFTFIYSIITILLNIFGMLEGPYYFLMVRHQSLLMSFIWIVLIYSLAYYISYSLKVFHMKINGG